MTRLKPDIQSILKVGPKRPVSHLNAAWNLMNSSYSKIFHRFDDLVR
jgi:hypothetical protein